ncbi:MAG: leucyl aminopeptidase [Sphingomonadaceae bacterium]
MTEVRFATEAGDAAALVLFVGANGVLTAGAKAADAASGGQIGRAMKAANFDGKARKIIEILAPAGLQAGRVLLVGIGESSKADARLFEDLGGEVAARLRTLAASVAADFTGIADLAISTDVAAAHFGHGVELRSWNFDRYRTKQKDEQKAKLTQVTLVGARATPESEHLGKIAAGIAFTKELVSEPANVIYPESFVARVREKVEPLGIKVRVLDEAEMAQLGMGALLGVAQGSARPPRMLVLEWNGAGGDTAPVALVGKGVTFDTGGISIKPAAGMEDMKWDMGGAGLVAGVMVALAGRKAKTRVVGVCGLVENMPDGKAQRPGDVVRSMSGQTVEVINTDAEGRLVLCDALTFVQREYKPKVIIDFATLTGAIIVSLAHEYAGLFTNSDTLAERLIAAGNAVNDKLWRQPLSEVGGHYDQMIDSPIADMKNVGERWGGSITAAQFLQRFIENDTPWAHVDIAGTVWRPKAGPLHDKGATGYGIRLVDRLIADHYEG